MFKDVPLSEFYRLINHGPCVLVTTAFEEKTNIAPIAWTTPVNDDPPLLGLPIAESHFTTELIDASGEFAVNVPDRSLIHAVTYTGKTSGRTDNKFRSAGLTPAEGIRIRAPHLKEGIGFLECRVRDRRVYDGVVLFVAEVVTAAADAALYDSCWITEKAGTVHHLGGGYFAATGKRFRP